MQGIRPAGLPGIMASALLATGCSGTPATHPRDAGTPAAPAATEPRAVTNDLRRSIAELALSVPVNPEHVVEVRERLAQYRVDGERGELARVVAEAIRREL